MFTTEVFEYHWSSSAKPKGMHLWNNTGLTSKWKEPKKWVRLKLLLFTSFNAIVQDSKLLK